MDHAQSAREAVYRQYWRNARLDRLPFTEVDYVVARRVLLNISQKEMANRLGIGLAASSRYERGRNARGIPDEIAAKIEQMVQDAMN